MTTFLCYRQKNEDINFRRAQTVVPGIASTTDNLCGVTGDCFHFTDGEDQNPESAGQGHRTSQFAKAHSYPLFHLIIATIVQVRPGQFFKSYFLDDESETQTG